MQRAPAASCPKCATSLPDGAAFCYKCGTPTPAVISGAGEMQYTQESDRASSELRSHLQRLLGESCELRGILGRGGFAEVYEAWDTRLKRQLAVKTLRPDLVTSTALLERFRLEAEAIAQLRHPHVIPIYSVGGEGDVAYFVMPKVDGESLAALLARGDSLSVHDSVRMLREAASALATAHRAGIIHRDVKPENILLDGHERRVLVTDFGIAKSLDAADKGLTGTGMLVGTPQYMSPEQAAGDRNIDHRSDQYALGIVAYRMLTGALPFDGDSAQTIIFRQVTETPRSIIEAAPGVPQPVAAVIERALAKRPADRFESMDAFMAALDSSIQTGAARSSRAPLLPLGARIEAMRRELARARHPLTLLAIAAAIVSIALLPRAVSDAAHQDASKRVDAVFAAKSHLTALGVSGSLTHVAAFQLHDSLEAEKFLRSALGARELERRAESDVPLWSWRVHLKTASDRVPWTIDLGRNNRVVEFWKRLPDSASAPATTLADAETLALRELAARGWSLSALRRMPDSVITRSNRTDYLLRWMRTTGGVPAAAGDTGFIVTAVRVSGPAVTGYTEHFQPPRSVRDRASASTHSQLFGMIVLFLVVAAFGIAVAVLISRSRRDELQWGMAVRVALLVVVCFLPEVFKDIREASFVGGESATAAASAVAIGYVFLLGIALLGIVLVETLAAEHRPALIGGLNELVRGRLMSPELAAASVTGAIWGGVTFAALRLVDFIHVAATGGPRELNADDFVSAQIPALTIVSELAGALLVATLAAALQLVLFNWRRSWLFAFVGTLVVFGAVMVAAPDARWTSVASNLIGFGLTAFVVWRYGLLAGVLAGFLSSSLEGLGAALWFGTSAGLAAGLLGLALVAAVFAPGVIALRKLSGAATAK